MALLNGVAIDVAKDVLPVGWMEVYPFRSNQSEFLLHAEINELLFLLPRTHK